jgi:hypothetical protein
MDPPRAKQFSMNLEGRLLDEHGRELEVARTDAFSLKVNQKLQKNKQQRDRFKANLKKERDFTRSFFFDTNLPKKRPANERISALRFEESKPTLTAEIVPEVEWWDRSLVGQNGYHADLNEDFLIELQRSFTGNVGADAKTARMKLEAKVGSLTISYAEAQITDVVQRPTPIETIAINTTSHSVPMHLTERERKTASSEASSAASRYQRYDQIRPCRADPSQDEA